MKTLRKALAVLAAVAGLTAVSAAADDIAPPRPIVVELFTSQGCSSCPPADALLGKLAQRPDVIALSLPITYWDMLGWKDTLASDVNTRRQKAYAQSMGHGGVYTPQIIVDGLSDVVGSREASVKAAIAARRAYLTALQARVARQPGSHDMLDVSVTLTASPREVRVVVGPARDHALHDATIWLMRVMSQATVKIGAGENEGRTMTYTNVVRDVRAIGMWRGPSVTVDVPRNDSAVRHDGVVVVVQQQGYGRIIGASYLDHSNYYAEQ